MFVIKYAKGVILLLFLTLLFTVDANSNEQHFIVHGNDPGCYIDAQDAIASAKGQAYQKAKRRCDSPKLIRRIIKTPSVPGCTPAFVKATYSCPVSEYSPPREQFPF